MVRTRVVFHAARPGTRSTLPHAVRVFFFDNFIRMMLAGFGLDVLVVAIVGPSMDLRTSASRSVVLRAHSCWQP